MTRSQVVRLGVLVLLVVAVTVPTARVACAATCNTYWNSKPTWFQDYGAVCAYTGTGCRECVGAGYTVCVDTPTYPVCLDYQDY